MVRDPRGLGLAELRADGGVLVVSCRPALAPPQEDNAQRRDDHEQQERTEQ
jgi:hypothetical protein